MRLPLGFKEKPKRNICHFGGHPKQTQDGFSGCLHRGLGVLGQPNGRWRVTCHDTFKSSQLEPMWPRLDPDVSRRCWIFTWMPRKMWRFPLGFVLKQPCKRNPQPALTHSHTLSALWFGSLPSKGPRVPVLKLLSFPESAASFDTVINSFQPMVW